MLEKVNPNPSAEELAREHKKIVSFLHRVKNALTTTGNDNKDKKLGSGEVANVLRDQKRELSAYMKAAPKKREQASGVKEAIEQLKNTIEFELGERFFDRSNGPTDPVGGSPMDSTNVGNFQGQAGSFGYSRALQQQHGNSAQCPICGTPMPPPNQGKPYQCPGCSRVWENFLPYEVASKQGGNGVYNAAVFGYLRVPGGDISTNEDNGKLKIKYLGEGKFKVWNNGTWTEHSLHNANEVFSLQLSRNGYNRDRLMGELIEWLFQEAKPGETYSWNLCDNTRTILNSNGFNKFHRHSGIG